MTPPGVDKHDRARFGLTMISNLMLGELGGNLEERLYRGILHWLSDPYGISVVRGQWQVVWGPAIKQFKTELYAVNAMYVARKVSRLPPDHPLADPTDPDEPAAEGKPPHYVIAIAGTNPTSPFDWFVEDFLVSKQTPWVPTPDGDPDAQISGGTSIGLRFLLDLEPGQGRPSAGDKLVEFLSEQATQHSTREIDLWVCGHSLGGALAPTLALWLAEDGGVRDEWDPGRKARIHIMPMAGASPGNAAFADRLEAAFPGDLTRRYCNTLDVVPHAWEPAHLGQIPDLYGPNVPARPVIEVLSAWARYRSRNGDYADVRSLLRDFEGVFDLCRFNPNGYHVINFLNQMVYQHIHAYFAHFDVNGGEMLDKIPPLPTTVWEVLMALGRALGIVGDWASTDASIPTPPAATITALTSAAGVVGRAVIQQLPVLRHLPRVGPLAPRTIPSPRDGHPVRIRQPDGRAAQQVQTQLVEQQRQTLQRSRDVVRKR